MGLAKNPNVAVTFEKGDEPILSKLEIVSSREGQYSKAFVFAQVRSREEDALSYVVIGRNEPEGAALQEFFQSLLPEHPLRNVRDAFFLDSKSLVGGDPVALSSCCVHSKNVAVLLAGKIDKEWDTVTLLDRYVRVQFDEKIEEPSKKPMLVIDIKTKPHERAKYCVCK